MSEIRLEYTENGRPYLADAPDLWFSFSSCRFGMLGAWSSTHGIGVDIEDHTRELEAGELARQYFSVAEAEAIEGAGGVERLRTFYRFWTLKEAALKSIGEGLPFGLDAFEFELDPRVRVVHAPVDTWRTRPIQRLRNRGNGRLRSSRHPRFGLNSRVARGCRPSHFSRRRGCHFR